MQPGQIIFQGKTKKDLEILVRYPQQGDAQLLCDYINTLSLEKTFIRFQGEQVSLEDEQKYLDNQLKGIGEGTVAMLLVFDGIKLIAVSDINMKDKAEKHIGYFGISVAKEYRGKGIGGLLMDLVIKEAEKNLKDLKIIELSVFSDNPVAMSLYEKFGFQKFGILPEGVLHADVPVDHIYMYKKVA
ncbi:MAG: GNAT family protein [Microgenomates group bacterium]|jgi:RimJ/RimL family protein N-acetyltransferase